MKKLFIFSLVLLILSCQGEREFGIPPSDTFVKLYGGNGEQEGYDLLHMPDEGFLLLGSTSSIGKGGTDIYLIRTDAFGNEIWSQVYGEIWDDMGKKLLRTNETTLILGQQTNDLGNTDIVVFSINEIDGTRSGNVDAVLGWPNSNEQASDIIDTGDGFLIVGSTTNVDLSKTPQAENDSQDIFIIKINNAGNVIWQRVYGNLQANGNEGIDEGTAVIKATQGYLILANTDFSAQNGQSNTNVRLIHINEDGRLLDARVYGLESKQTGRDLLISQTGEIYLLGSSQEKSHFYKLDQSFTQTTSVDISGKEAYAMTESLDGDLFITGQGFQELTKSNPIFTTRVSPGGSEQAGWPKYFGDRKESIGRSIIQLPDEKLAVCGTINFGSNKMMCLIKTDEGGNLVR